MISNNTAVSVNRFRPAKPASETASGSASGSASGQGESATNERNINGAKYASVNPEIGAKQGGTQEQGQSSMDATAALATALGSTLTEAQLADIIARDTLPSGKGSDSALENITQQFKDRFASQAANKEQFHALLKKSFGDNYDVSKAENMRQQTLKGDFSWMPKIEVVSSAQLTDTSGQQGEGVALGAYNKKDNTVYISSELLKSDPAKAEKILTEEVGHAIDASINTSDAAGDEGAIFSKLSHGENISQSELKALRTENDKGVIEINGEKVEVEYNFISKAFKGIKNAVKGVTDGIKNIRNKIKDSVSKAWDKVKDVVKKALNSKWLGVILKVASFIPGIGAVAAIASTVLTYAKAAYGVYQGIKNKSMAAVLGGVASLAAGASGIASNLGASAGVVNTLSNVANYAGKASQAYSAIKNKDIGAVAGMAAGMAGADTNVGKAFSTIAKGDAVYQAHKNGDALGAISAGTGFLQDFTGDKGDKTLQTIAKTSTAFGNMQTAIKNNDYSAALGAANEAFGGNINFSPEARQSVEKLTGTITKLRDAQKLYESGDFLSAGQTLLSQISAYTTNDNTQQDLAKVGQALVKVDAAVTAYKENRYDAAAALAADALGAPLDDKTKALLSNIQNKANQAQDLTRAVKSQDVAAISTTLNSLSNGATEGLTERLGVISGGLQKAKALSLAIDNKDFGKAATMAAELSSAAAGKDSDLAKTLGTLSDLLNGKIQISLSDILHNTGATPGINPSAEAA